MREIIIVTLAVLWSLLCGQALAAANGEIVQRIARDCEADPALAELLANEYAYLDLIYSNRLVTAQMRAIGFPPGTPKERVAAWLALYGLGLTSAGSGKHLVVPIDQKPAFVVGQLVDAEGHPLSATNFSVNPGGYISQTSGSGCFLLPVEVFPENTYSESTYPKSAYLEVNGFQAYLLPEDRNDWWRIQLDLQSTPRIEEVSVIGSRFQMMHSSLALQHYLDREQIERLPHLGDDVTRVFRHLPGTASGDYSPKANVRGGQANENAMILDGLELHRPWYFKSLDGLVSTVDSNIIGSADFLSGGYTAEYGGRTSSITDIQTLRPEELPRSFGVSFLTAYGQTGNTFNDGRAGWMTSLRFGYLDLAFQLAGSDADVSPHYYDVFSKIETELGWNSQLEVNFLTAHDRLIFDFGYPGEDLEYLKDNSANNNVWMNLRTDFSEHLWSIHSLSFTDYTHQLLGYFDQPQLLWEDDRSYQAVGLKADWGATPGSNHLFKWGVSLKSLEAEYDYFLSVYVLPTDENTQNFVNRFRESRLRPSGGDEAAYLAYRVQLFDMVTTEIGGRWSQQTYNELDEGIHFSPRFNLVYDITPATQISASWGRFYQAQSIDGLRPGDGNEHFFPTQEAEHSILGLRHRLNQNWDFRLDVYQKEYDQVLPRYDNLYENIARYVNEAAADRVFIAPDRATAEGLEAGVNYDSGEHFSAWVNYSYSEVYDYFDNREYPRAWDQRHNANFSLNWEYDTWNFNIAGMFRSGWPVTPFGEGEISGGVVPADVVDYNSERLDHYARIDVRATRKVDLKGGDSFQYYLEIYNLLNAENECCITYETGDSSGEVPEFENWLPLMPSFGIRYQFK